MAASDLWTFFALHHYAICIATSLVDPSSGSWKSGVKNMIIIHAFVERVRRWAMYRNTVRELSVLSDRDLSDLGINRSDIEYVARKHASAV
jgi:uncharacterized protein YjiS (DUF1127 family)